MGKSIMIFEVTPHKDGVDGMLKNVESILPYVANAPGFISAEPFASLASEGRYCFLCVFESEEAAAQWRDTGAHRSVQKDGRDTLFADYKITIGSVVREYSHDDRKNAPQDSNAYFDEHTST